MVALSLQVLSPWGEGSSTAPHRTHPPPCRSLRLCCLPPLWQDSYCATWTVEEHLPSFHPTATPKASTLLPSGCQAPESLIDQPPLCPPEQSLLTQLPTFVALMPGHVCLILRRPPQVLPMWGGISAEGRERWSGALRPGSLEVLFSATLFCVLKVWTKHLKTVFKGKEGKNAHGQPQLCLPLAPPSQVPRLW